VNPDKVPYADKTREKLRVKAMAEEEAARAVTPRTLHRHHQTFKRLNPVSASPWRWRSLARGQVTELRF